MNPIKVFYQGKRLRDVYPHATRWQVFKFKVRRLFIGVTKVALFLGVIVGAGWAGANFFPETVIAMQEVHVNTLPERLDDLKDDVVARLEACESGGRKESDGIVVLDTNDRGSYGVMQWQRKSVMHYYKLRTGEDINGRDAIILALSADRARDLAKWVIFETNNGVEKDWYNCSKKHGLQAEVNIIKKIAAHD